MLPERITRDTAVTVETKVALIKEFVETSKDLRNYELVKDNKKLIHGCDNFLIEIKKALKSFEDVRKTIVQPLNAEVSEINEWFKEKSKVVEGFNKEIMGNLSAYKFAEREEQRKINEAEQKRIEDLKKKAELKIVKIEEKIETGTATKKDFEKLKEAENVQTLAVPYIHVEEKTTAKMKTVYSISAINKELFLTHCLNTRQLDFVEVNTKMIEKIINTSNGAVKMPGIDVKKEEVMQVRVNRY